MRIPRRVEKPFSFGLLSLLGFVTVSAFMIWCGAIGVLIALACIAAHYTALAVASIFVTNRSQMPDSTWCDKWRFATPDDGSTLRTTVTAYLIFHYVWHIFWLLVMLPGGFPVIWHTPSFGPLTLAHLDRLCILGLSLILVTSYLSGAYAGVRFSRRICVETSTLLTFLLASQFTIPP